MFPSAIFPSELRRGGLTADTIYTSAGSSTYAPQTVCHKKSLSVTQVGQGTGMPGGGDAALTRPVFFSRKVTSRLLCRRDTPAAGCGADQRAGHTTSVGWDRHVYIPRPHTIYHKYVYGAQTARKQDADHTPGCPPPYRNDANTRYADLLRSASGVFAWFP